MNKIQMTSARTSQMIREDMTSPQLLNFSLDIDSGILDLTFDEPVLPSSIVFQNITIHNKYNRSDQSIQVYSLDYEYIDSNETGTVVVKVELTRVSLSALQSMTALALLSENTLISIKEGAILDMNDNPSIEIAFENAISAVEVSPDVSPQILESFDLDLNDNFLILSFTEAVNYETLNLSALLIVNSFNDSEVTEYQRISVNSEIIVADFGSVLYIELTEDDENALKEFMRPIANSRNDTYLSIEYGAVLDYARFKLNATADEFLQVSEYFEDLTCVGEMAEEYINTSIDDYYCHTPYYQGFIFSHLML